MRRISSLAWISGKRLSLLFIASFALIRLSDAAEAQYREAPQPLPRGLTFREVIGALGSPLRKVELEVKRESQWIYRDGRTLRFHEGRLVKDSLASEAGSRLALQQSSDSPAQERNSNREQQSNGRRVRETADGPVLSFTGGDVFRELAKLGSSEDEEDERRPGRNSRLPGQRTAR